MHINFEKVEALVARRKELWQLCYLENAALKEGFVGLYEKSGESGQKSLFRELHEQQPDLLETHMDCYRRVQRHKERIVEQGRGLKGKLLVVSHCFSLICLTAQKVEDGYVHGCRLENCEIKSLL